MTARRLEASHDGYVKGFGLVHQRRLILGNDGKEVRGEDQLTPKGRRKIREAAPYAIRFHLAPGRRGDASPPTAWARSCARPARRRGISVAAARCCRSRKACASTAAAGRADRCNWSSSAKYPAIGGEIAWQFRRSS